MSTELEDLLWDLDVFSVEPNSVFDRVDLLAELKLTDPDDYQSRRDAWDTKGIDGLDELDEAVDREVAQAERREANITEVDEDSDLGKRLRNEGMARAAAAENNDNPKRLDVALEAIRQAALHHEIVHADLVHEYLGGELHHPNAWGSVYVKAVKLGYIEEAEDVPRQRSTRPKAHAKRMTMYRSLIFAGS